MQTSHSDAGKAGVPEADSGSASSKTAPPEESNLVATAEQEQEYPPATKKLLATLRARFPLYALLDAARDPVILPLIEASKEPFQSLYQGESAEKLAVVAPYLVSLQKESPLLRMLARFAWGKSWGVYISASASLEQLRKHLRHFLMAEDPRGKEVYFRFYDPRVLRVYLPTCTAAELTTFLGPISKYLLESEDPSSELLEFTPAIAGRPAVQHKLSASDPVGADK